MGPEDRVVDVEYAGMIRVTNLELFVIMIVESGGMIYVTNLELLAIIVPGTIMTLMKGKRR